MIGTGEAWPLHHPTFRINDDVLLPAAHYLAALADAAFAQRPV